ncbi:MAG: MBL fold metallo-hydrolase [Bacteroidota bacterium]
MREWWKALIQRIKLLWERVPGTTKNQWPVEDPPIHLFVLPAHNGDAFLLEYLGIDQQFHRIWIDGGLVRSYMEKGRPVLQSLIQQDAKIDLMIVTHIDQDHIGGVLAFVNDSNLSKDFVERFWFNSGLLIASQFDHEPDRRRDVGFQTIGFQTRSLNQGIKLEEFLLKSKRWHDKPIQNPHEEEIAGAKLTVLSPNEENLMKLDREWEAEEASKSRSVPDTDFGESIEKLAAKEEEEDYSIANGSSIAFIFSLKNKRILFLGDAHPSDIVQALKKLGYSKKKKLKVSYVKLSHHASKRSVSYALLELIDCQNYIISTDGSRHGLPNKEALARVVLDPSRDRGERLFFLFNHNNAHLKSIFPESEQIRYNFQCSYPPDGQDGLLISF